MGDRQQIAILGGGMGGLSAAWAVTQQPEWAARYEVTVYQRGWRLGGKAASGRNLAKYGRIEEHGGHIWSGSFSQAIAMMRDCYTALPALGLREPEAPLGTFDKAFKSLNHLFVPEMVPGVPDVQPWRVGRSQNIGSAEWGDADRMLELAASLLGMLKLHAAQADDPISHRRTLTVVELLAAAVAGMRGDDAATLGFDHLDKWDVRSWLARHGAGDQALASSVMVAALDFTGGYPGFGHGGGGIGAGTFLKSLCAMLFAVGEEPLFWKMQASAGDGVFAPLYQVLAARGVEFRFFHAVEDFRLSPDARSIAEIDLVQQARPLNRYEPLVDVKSLPSWPSQPLWEQLEDGSLLRESAPCFEDESCLAAGEKITLKAGEDFDAAVLAIGIGALPGLTRELTAASPRWAAMLAHSATAPVRAAQLWLTVPSAEYGWKQLADRANPDTPSGNRPLQTLTAGLPGQWNSWTDVSDLLARADWGWDDRPWSAAAFTGLAPEPGDSSSGLGRTSAIGESAWLDKHLTRLWPHMRDGDGRFLYSALHDPEGRQGLERLDWQFIWEGVHGSQRQTLSAPGSLQYRLAPDDSGFRNLYLAGDWTLNGVNTASMEAAAVSGIQAASAIGISG